MLYITTRDNRDANTAYKTLHNDMACDGGAYVPFRMPNFSAEELEDLVTGSFSETVAVILNRFFSARITGWDVDFCIGRNSLKVVQMPHRLTVAELWHNPKGTYESVVTELYRKIAETDTGKPTEWFAIAVRIAVLFGIYTYMRQSGYIAAGETYDISLPCDDFNVPVAALYARIIGLPIDTIVCTGEENSGVWDFIHLGELNTSLIGNNGIGFERYVYATLNSQAVEQLLEAKSNKRTYRVSEDELSTFNSGMFCATAGKKRSSQTINSIYRSNQYILDPVAAICVGGLQDYRAKVGESKQTLVLSEISPLIKAKEISEATGISSEKLKDLI